jgi:uncharacterized repeat protein (TIGR01451 family)
MRRWLGVGIAGFALPALAGCEPQPQPWSSELVSVNMDGTDAGVDISWLPDVDAAGTKIVFEGSAFDLVPGDTNEQGDVFLRDLTAGTTELVSVNAAGTGSSNGTSTSPRLSRSGRYVAFTSTATDLGPPGGPAGWDVYVRDLVTGVTQLASPNFAGTAGGNLDSITEAFSDDGTKVAFESGASDLVANDTNGNKDLFVRDLVAGTTILLSSNAAGTDSTNGLSRIPRFSPDGTKVLFSSTGTDIVANDTDAVEDLYLRDLVTGTTTLVSVNAAGTNGGNGATLGASFNADATKVVFESLADDLGPTDTNGLPDIYVRDLVTGTTSLVSANAAGTDGGNRQADGAAFSGGGDTVVFASWASDLGPRDTNRTRDMYERNLTSGTTRLLSTNARGTNSGNARTDGAVYSPDGSKLLLMSDAGDLGPRDTNGVADVFVRDLATGRTTLVSADATGTDSARLGAFSGRWLGRGDAVVMMTVADDLGPTDTNNDVDIYLATLHGADVGVGLSATPEPVGAGGELSYELAVGNEGPDTAEDARAALLLPDGTTFAEATTTAGSCAAQAQLVVCELGDLPAGDDATVTITATVSAPTGSTLTALAAVDTTTLDLDTTDGTATAATTVS